MHNSTRLRGTKVVHVKGELIGVLEGVDPTSMPCLILY